MLIREARKSTYFSHNVLGGSVGFGQSRIICMELDQRPQKVTMLKAFPVVERASSLVDLMEQQVRAA